jgi:HSP20 family protein
MYPGIATTKEFRMKVTKPISFRDSAGNKSSIPVLLAPAANIWESPELYRIVVAAPGLSREDFNIEINDGIVYIAGRNEVVSANVNDRREYDFTDWARNFILPDDADVMLSHARYLNGELVICIPRGNTTGNPSKTPVYVY